MKKACKQCHYISEGNKCPVCGGEDFSNRFSGTAIIIDPTRSEIAKKINVNQKGEYALIVR